MTHSSQASRPARLLLVAGLVLPLTLIARPQHSLIGADDDPQATPPSATPSPTDTPSPSDTPTEAATLPATSETATETLTPAATQTTTVEPTGGGTPTHFPGDTPTETATLPAASETATETLTPTPTQTATVETTGSETPTETPSPTSSQEPTAIAPQTIWINEVAWAGTRASSSDEWIELYNPGPADIDLSGWSLTDGGDINISLRGTLPAGALFLLERTDDSTIRDIPADQIYTGSLHNNGERLLLRDPSGASIDSVNGDGGPWPAGQVSSKASMERRGGDGHDGDWATFTGYFGTGRDADGNPIAGTPRALNSVLFPVPTATWIPGRVVINEVLIRPHHDWEGAGGVTTGGEVDGRRGPGLLRAFSGRPFLNRTCDFHRIRLASRYAG